MQPVIAAEPAAQSARGAKLRELFDQLLDVPAHEQAKQAHRLSAGDAALANEALELLRFDQISPSEAVNGSLAVLVQDLNGQAQTAETPHALIGSQIGAWHVLEELGSGGMGTVYRVKKRGADFTQQAALKLIRGFPTSSAIERFRRERRMLAALEHPNIARLIDGGATDAGQPYLVMALIEGQPLHLWQALQKPSAERCARLMQTLCQAVHYAHQHQIVHRDLKPGNILVDANEQPMLLDFGIAKLLDATSDPGGLEGGQNPNQTPGLAITAAMIMTPAYASPEQRTGSVTTASDTFALGKIFAEMLETLDHTAAPPELLHIAHMAHRPEPERRYLSASAMADDIARYFAGKPVRATPDSAGYRIRKFVLRNKIAVAAASTILLASLVFVWRLGVERDLALAAEQRARIEANNAEQVALLMRDLFKQADPDTAQGKSVSALDMLEKGELAIRADRKIEPQVRARLGALIGEIYITIGDSKRSTSSLKDAIALMRTDPKTPASALAGALHHYGRALESAGQADAAEIAALEAVKLYEQQLGLDAPEVGESLNSLGVVQQVQARWDAARASYERAERIFLPQADRFADQLASTQHNLGWLAFQTGKYEEASKLLTHVLATKRARLGPEHPRVLNTLLTLSQTRAAMNDLQGAHQLATELLSSARKVYGETSERTLRAHNELATVSHDLGRYTQAGASYAATQIPLDRAAPAPEGDLLAGDSIDAAIHLNNIASLLEDQGDYAASQLSLRQSIAMRMRLFEPTHPSIARTQHNLARVLLGQALEVRASDAQNANAASALIQESESLATLSRATREKTLPTGSLEQSDSTLLQARLLLAQGKREAAAVLLAQLANPMSDPALTSLRAARWFDALIEQARASQNIEAIRRVLLAKRARLSGKLPAAHPILALIELDLATLSWQAGDRQAAQKLAAPAAAILQQELSPKAGSLLRLKQILAP